MLLAQCDTRFVLSDVKLALLEVLAPEHDVIVLQRLGLPDERIITVALAELDRTVEPDHLTSVFVDTGEVARRRRARAARRAHRAAARARADARGTRRRPTTRLRRHVLEEAYEVAAAIEELPAGSARRRHSDRARTTRSRTSSATCSSR